jgi:Fe-S cluster assembly protein SufD
LAQKRSGTGGMMKTTFDKGNADWYSTVFNDLESRLNGQKSTDLHQLRKRALRSFQDLGYPTTKHEEWKYTNVSSLINYNFEISDSYSSGKIGQKNIKKFQFNGLADRCLVFVNGHFSSGLSNTKGITENIEILSLKKVIDKNPELLSSHFAKYVSIDDQSFISLNTAFIQDGIYINIAEGICLEKPVQLLYLSVPEAKPKASFPRNLIIAGRSSEIKLIETYAAIKEGIYFTDAVSEIVLHENSKVERIKIQIESDQAYHIAALQAVQERDSRFIDHNISLGGALTRNDISSKFNGENGFCELYGMYSGNHKQHIDNHTTIDHATPRCESHELYKGILDEDAEGVFNGKIFVRPDAQKTNAIQSNNCILLSDQATIDTKPQLEIFADDVKCTHGATVGQLNEDAYFYMRARGIDKSNARKLLIYAFASEVVDKITFNPVREKVLDWFSDKLNTVKPK